MSTSPEGARRGPTDPSRGDLFREDTAAGNDTARRDTGPIQTPPRTSAASAPTTQTPAPAVGPAPDHESTRRDVRAQQKDRFGGIKWGAAFFGWLTAIGTAVLLSALLTAIGGAVGLSVAGGAGQAADQAGQAAQNPGAAQTAGIVGAVVLVIAYYCGGYVAGRMARFNGAKQGIAVWVWTIIITVLAAILVAVAGAQFNVLGSLGGLQLPADPAALGIAGIIGVLIALAVSLIGAILGGLAGMRFHRRIDRADLDDRRPGNR